jgi:Uma2 family endonuclease
MSELDLNGTYTYADYLLWRFEERLELIKGKIFKMSPAPSTKHQRIAGQLHGKLFPYFEKHPCQLFIAPFDVRLLDKKKLKKINQDVYTVVQPDLCVICDKNKLDEKGCLGSPDLIVEILSPDSSQKDLKIKYAIYEEVEVKEYWVIFPFSYVLQQFVLNEKGKYELKGNFTEDEVFTAHLFPDLEINLGEVFME